MQHEGPQSRSDCGISSDRWVNPAYVANEWLQRITASLRCLFRSFNKHVIYTPNKACLAAFPQLTKVEVQLGRTVILPCNVSDTSRGELDVRWEAMGKAVAFFQDGQLMAGQGYEGRIELQISKALQGDFSLTLRSVMMSDTDLYQCLWQGRRSLSTVTFAVLRKYSWCKLKKKISCALLTNVFWPRLLKIPFSQMSDCSTQCRVPWFTAFYRRSRKRLPTDDRIILMRFPGNSIIGYWFHVSRSS